MELPNLSNQSTIFIITIFILLLIIVFLCVCKNIKAKLYGNNSCNCDIYKQYNNITSNETFSGKVSTKPTLSLYYTHKCPYCVQFLPVWEEFTNTENGKYNINIKKTECSSTKAPDYVRGFPTVVFEANGKAEIFEDERTVQNLNKFIEQKLAALNK